MPMKRDDLGRPFILDVCARGSVAIRERGSALEQGFLPAFSTDTREQAETLRIRHCRRANDGSGLYHLNDRPKCVEDLGHVSDLFRGTYETLTTPRDAASAAEKDHGLLADLAATQPEEVVLVNDLREGRGTHHPRVLVLSIDADGDAECKLVRSGHRKRLRIVTLSKAYALIERDHRPAEAP